MDNLKLFKDYITVDANNLNASLNNYPKEAELAITLWGILHEKLLIKIDDKAIGFILYKSQVDKAIFLSIAASLRLHGSESLSDLRYSMDAMKISLYALGHVFEFLDILKNKSENATKLSEDIDKKSNAWIETNEKSFSDKLKLIKMEVTHRYGAHVAFAMTTFNASFDKTGGTANITIVDKPNDEFSKQRLIFIADMLRFYIEAIIRQAKTHNIVLNKEIIDTTFKENIKKLDEYIEIKRKVIYINKKMGV